MTTIEIKNQLKTKEYLENFSGFEFQNLIHLIFELFENHQHGQKEIMEIEVLLDEIGYSNLKEISESEKEAIKRMVFSKIQDWKRQEDSEFLSYKLMAAIFTNNIIAIIDNHVIDNFESPISITANSVISFITNSKLESISFTTL